MKPKYALTSQIISPWFGKPYVLYTLTSTTEVWFDPSYGNGGGEYVNRTTSIFSSKVLAEVHTMQRKSEVVN